MGAAGFSPKKFRSCTFPGRQAVTSAEFLEETPFRGGLETDFTPKCLRASFGGDGRIPRNSQKSHVFNGFQDWEVCRLSPKFRAGVLCCQKLFFFVESRMFHPGGKIQRVGKFLVCSPRLRLLPWRGISVRVGRAGSPQRARARARRAQERAGGRVACPLRGGRGSFALAT